MNKKKDVQPAVKPKASKQKTVAVKGRIKNVPPKRLKNTVKEKTKPKPAPIVEPGFSLYSTASENSISGEIDTCSEVLARLKERRKESIQSDSNAPFNQRLSSSTPDPEKAKHHSDQGNIFQTVPEKDDSGPIIKENVADKFKIPFTALSAGFQGTNFSTESGIYGYTQEVLSREVINTSSSGFVPTLNNYTDADIKGWMRRDSDIQTYQAYIPRESTGFAVDNNAKKDEDISKDDSKGHSSGSSGAKEISQLILKQTGLHSINSSGTEYVVLPCPQGGTGGAALTPGTPVVQLQNGLFQIRPAGQGQVQENMCREQLTENKQKMTSSFQKDLSGSYLGADAFQIPERDHNPAKNMNEIQNGSNRKLQDTFSTITGTGSQHNTITPVSQRSASTNMTQRSISSENTGNAPMGDNPVENIDDKLKRISENESSTSTHKDQNKLLAEIHRGETERHLTSNTHTNNVSSHSGNEGHSNVNSQNSQNTHVTNLSGLSGQGQIFLIQTSQGTFATGGNTSVQLVPVSLLPNSNINTSVAMATNKPETTSIHTSGQYNQKTVEIPNQPVMSTETSSAEKSQIPNPWSKVKMDAGLKKLRYLLGELRECGKIGKDLEVGRLVKEVEKTLETIPTLSSKFNLMAEIDLCLQPLRNENCQLRRKLRLANQQMKEKEVVKEKAALDFDVIHLQSSNTALQKQLAGEKETKVKLAFELKELHSQIQRMKIERSKLLAALSEKETDELKVKQECLTDTQKFRHEIEQLQRQTEGIEMKYESLEQENHILQITLQQRDTEINKMQALVNEVKDCVGSLIEELEDTKTGEKSFISNNSYSLQKLVKVLGEDSVASFSQKKSQVKNPEEYCPRQKQSTSSKTPLTPRLTRQTLASHNKILTKQKMPEEYFNMENMEEYKTSTSDTEVELQIENERRKSTPRRGHSMSPPHRRAPLRERNPSFGKSLSPRRRKYPSPDEKIPAKEVDYDYKTINRSLSPSNLRNPKVAFDFSKTSYRQDSTDFQQDFASNGIQSCNQSEASRYSVTDYFKKYPKNQLHSRDHLHQRSYSQPSYNTRLSNTHMTPTDSRLKDGNFSHSVQHKNTPVSPQDNLYHGTCLDNSLSAINDDNISSVSEQTSATGTTINDTSFRRGIATLDANILKLQLALQKTKSMLS